jgi:hypothetical protein
MVNPTFSLGTFTFNDLRSFLTNTPARFLGLTPAAQFDRYWRFTLMGFYLQDSWKIHPRFTINPGIRYEFATMPIDIYGRDSALLNLFTDREPVSGQLYQNPTRKNFSPRFGFAWDPTGSGRTSLRGGYALIFNTNNQQNLIVTVTNPPATPRVSIVNPTFPNPPFERGIGNTIRPVEWNIRNPYVQTWNVNLQHQLPASIVVTLGYAGSRGIHLLRSNDVNIVEPVRQADGTLVFPAGAPRRNPAFTTIELKSSDGNSWYHAGIFEVRKRLAGICNCRAPTPSPATSIPPRPPPSSRMPPTALPPPCPSSPASITTRAFPTSTPSTTGSPTFTGPCRCSAPPPDSGVWLWPAGSWPASPTSAAAAR